MKREMELPPLPQTLLAGVSGGADSVALLLLLVRAGKQVTAVHVNHGLRGADSDGDEVFVRELCARMNVPLLTYRAQPPLHPSENWAREVRYAFFREAMAQSGAQALALAHHRDDQAETLLLHLLRGSGLQGLCGMAEDVRQADGLRIVRPLLKYARRELREMLEAEGQAWREDGSNGDPRYLRNQLRLETIPQMEQIAPGASERMAAAARILREDRDALDALTERFMAAHAGLREIPLAPLNAEPVGLQKRILRLWWQRAAGKGSAAGEGSLDAARTDALHALTGMKPGSRCNLPGGWHGYRGWTHLHLQAPDDKTALAEQPLADCPYLRVVPAAGQTGDGLYTQAIPAAWLEELTVRSRRTGDWIRPFGMTGRQSLQDFMTNRRVDAPFRDRVPLVCRGSEVLLAVGVGAGAIPRAGEADATVLLTCTETLPWCRKTR